MDSRGAAAQPKYKDFEDFLQEKHAWQYEGLDDEMPDDYERWLTELDITDVIKWADEYAELYARSAPKELNNQ